MSLTTGSVTIKTSGGDYSSWAGFWDDLGDLTGDITCTVDASAFTEATAPAAVTESLNGHTLHVLPASFPTTTDASTGARFTCNYTTFCLSLQMVGDGDVIIEGIVFIEGAERQGRSISCDQVSTAFNLTIRRNICKGGWYGIYHQEFLLDSETKIYNNICLDTDGPAIQIIEDIPNAIVANNTAVNCSIGFDCGDEEVSLKNNLSYSNTAADFSNIELLTNGYNNAASDSTNENADWGGTGADNVSSISDPFNGLASDDFTITAEGDVGKAGKDLSASFTDDFFGVTRDNWTIGACEYITPVFSKPIIIGKNIKYQY